MPEALAEVPVPDAVLIVMVVLCAPVLAGSNETAPLVQEAPEAIVAPAVQVPLLMEKSAESVSDSGVADKTTAPPEAVKVRVPQERVLPSVSVPQLSELTDADSDP